MFNKSKCQIKNLTILAPSAAAALGAVVFISVFLFSAGQAKAVDYYNEGILKSTNVLSGASVTAINSFTVTSSMAATASTSAQFSQDRVNFYSSAGVEGGWDSCVNGSTVVDISGLGWSGGLLFYKLKLETSDASTTPSVADIQVDYDGTEVPADSGIRYPNEGFLVSEDLLAGLSGNLNGSEKFGYDITSLPAGTAVYAQFSQDGENWYNSSGTKWGWDTLSAGSHLEKAGALGLSGLGWSGDNFYYKLKFTTVDSEQTPVVSEISLLRSATQINAPITNKSSGGLVGDWTFNGPDMDWASTTAEALDRSGEANNGNVIGAKAAIGISGQGLEFDGADDYVDAGDVYNGVKTIAFWIKADSTTEDIIDLDGGTHTASSTSGTITANGFVSPAVYVDGSVGSTITTEWHYIVFTTETAINANDMDIGRIGASYFDGILDEVRIYNRALSAEEIAEQYRAGAGTMQTNSPITNYLTGGLAGQWTFNGPDMDWASTTAEALDRSGNSNNGNVIGAVAAIGKVGQGLEFDGSDDYINCGNVYDGIKTVSFWIKADSITEKIIDLNGTADIEVVGGTITANNFSQTIYVDGSLGSTIDAEWHYVSIATSTGINAGAVDIGRIGADYFDGILDEVRFYDYALSADEILKHYRVWSRTMKIDPAK